MTSSPGDGRSVVDTDRREQVAHDRHVGDVGHVREVVFAVGEQGRSHQLEHGVLRTRDDDLTLQRTGSMNDDDSVGVASIGERLLVRGAGGTGIELARRHG